MRQATVFSVLIIVSWFTVSKAFDKYITIAIGCYFINL